MKCLEQCLAHGMSICFNFIITIKKIHVILFLILLKGGHYLGLLKGETEVKTNIVVKKKGKKQTQIKNFKQKLTPQPGEVSKVRERIFLKIFSFYLWFW